MRRSASLRAGHPLRHLLLGALLFAVYAASAVVDSAPGSRYGETEARLLLTAGSLVDDRDLDVSDEYAGRDFAPYFPGPLESGGSAIAGRLHEPHSPGLPLLISPAHALAGASGAALLCALVAALAFVVALSVARLVVPDPWASWGVALVGASPPAVAHATEVDPGFAAAALLGIAILFGARVRDEARVRDVTIAASALALLPWLDAALLVAALPVAALLLGWTLRQHRRMAALIAVELIATSLIAFTALAEALHGGLTPYAAAHGDALGAGTPSAYLERAPRLVALWLDRDGGLLRWAPVLALALHGAWLAWRSHRDRIARALPGRRVSEAAGALVAAACAGQILVAAFGAPEPAGDSFPGRWLTPVLPLAVVLVAWSLRRLPRTGAALGAMTLAGSVWLGIDLATGAVDAWGSAPAGSGPWGPLEGLFPTWDGDPGRAGAVTFAVAAGVVALVVFEWRAARARRGMTDTVRSV